MPWLEGSSPMISGTKVPTTQDIADMLIRNNYLSALAIIGWDYAVMPTIARGGNVVQPYIEVKLSLRCSPYTDVEVAAEELKKIIEAPPFEHGAKVTFTVQGKAPGFAADPLPQWYRNVVDEAAVPIYGAKMLDAGKGGTIGFLNTIQKELDGAIIHNAGLFDPAAKGHAPDESVDVVALKKFTSVMTYTLSGIMTADKTLIEPATEVPMSETMDDSPEAETMTSDATKTSQILVGLTLVIGSMTVASLGLW